MSFYLKNRSLFDLESYEPRDIRYLLDLAADLKRKKRLGNERQHLSGKNIAVVYEQIATRVRCAFEVAVRDQGGEVSYIDLAVNPLAYKESLADKARWLERLYDGIEYCGFEQSDVEAIAGFSHVPVWNGMTSELHPTQVLADLMTMEESGETPLHLMSFCYLGDARGIACPLLVGGVQMGMDVRIAGPVEMHPPAELVARMRVLAKRTGARISIETDAKKAVEGVDFIYTNVWVTKSEHEQLGDNNWKAVWKRRIEQLFPYQVRPDLMLASGNPRTKFMHGLPAIHNTETEMGRAIYEHFGLREMSVTEEVFESAASIVFTQAENRMHAIKAALVATLG
ncbi:MAG TPA: ornithine carbamoyltransferase [Fluviicoccus sp.]|nr:ornithine carbamoyltransferase [Fluviicoccus sp.]